MPSTNVNSAPAEEKKKKRSGFFGLGKKKKNSDGSSTVRKTKFKKIKGFLRGESKKSKGGSKTQTPPDTPTSPPAPKKDDDDASSTVYNVDVDDRSIASNSTAPRTDTSLLGSESEALLGLKRSMLKVVLLLMDPMTRRFELLQLEFDSEKALVSDVLAQIPLSVTEPSLRTQTFEGIVGKDGQEMTHHQLLAEKVSGNEVLVAVPKGSNAKDCSRLARPILGDDKVVTMVSSRGSDSSCLRSCVSDQKNLDLVAAQVQWHRWYVNYSLRSSKAFYFITKLIDSHSIRLEGSAKAQIDKASFAP